MKTVLSIQSHVAYGYVGNRAAVFPLQRMGIDVHTINTVQFSNHTGYGAWTGQVFDKDHIQELIDGLAARGALDNLDAVLSGYLGDPALGQIVVDTVAKLHKHKPELIYCCDPVMGDTGRGFFVNEKIPPFFKDTAMPQTNIATPNQFELTALTGQDIHTRADAIKACRLLHENGPQTILLTSLITEETKDGEIGMMLSCASGDKWMLNTPRVELHPEPNGAGDMSAALLLGYILLGNEPKAALEKLSSNIYDVFKNTAKEGSRELALIQSQDSFMDNTQHFTAKKL